MTCKMRRPRHRPLVFPLLPLALLDATAPIHLLCIIAGTSPPLLQKHARWERARLSRPRHGAARHVLGYAPCRASLSLLLPCPKPPVCSFWQGHLLFASDSSLSFPSSSIGGTIRSCCPRGPPTAQPPPRHRTGGGLDHLSHPSWPAGSQSSLTHGEQVLSHSSAPTKRLTD